MSQMTEASKKRMEEISLDEMELLKMSTDHSGEHQYAADYRIGFRYGFNRGKKAGYESGMQDPEVNKELMEENKRLKKALKEISNSSPTLEAAMRTAHVVLGLQLPDDLKFKEDTRNDQA